MNQKRLESNNHWKSAAEYWRYVKSPLRPHSSEIKIFQNHLDEYFDRVSFIDQNALILGVTPELYQLRIPDSVKLLAVDQSRDMIDHVWPGGKNQAQQCNWLDLPVTENSRDVVLLDGGLMLLSWPKDQIELLEEIQRVLKEGGIFIVRLFDPDRSQESLSDVLNDLENKKIPDLNALKFRLWLVLHHDLEEGIRPHKVWQIINDFADGNLESFAESMKWPKAHVLALRNHKDSKRLYFMTGVQELVELCHQSGFSMECLSVSYPDHEFGQITPVAVFRKRKSPA